MKLVSILKSTNPRKKFDATFNVDGKNKIVSFGAANYEDFTIHHDIVRKNNYILRHEKNENWNKPDTPGACSRWILWNKPTLKASIDDFIKRFNLR